MPMGSSNNSDRYLSEDYAFCQLARHIGEKIYLCPWMQLGHVGTYVFDGTMSDLGRIDTSNPWADKNMRESDKLRQKRLQEVADAKARQENQQAVDEIENIQKQSESRKERRKATKKK